MLLEEGKDLNPEPNKPEEMINLAKLKILSKQSYDNNPPFTLTQNLEALVYADHDSWIIEYMDHWDFFLPPSPVKLTIEKGPRLTMESEWPEGSIAIFEKDMTYLSRNKIHGEDFLLSVLTKDLSIERDEDGCKIRLKYFTSDKYRGSVFKEYDFRLDLLP